MATRLKSTLRKRVTSSAPNNPGHRRQRKRPRQQGGSGVHARAVTSPSRVASKQCQEYRAAPLQTGCPAEQVEIAWGLPMKSVLKMLCYMALLLSFTTLASAADKTWTGKISDSMCGAQPRQHD